MAADPVRLGGGPSRRAAAVRVHALFEEHSRMVYGLCRALLRDPHDAEDATQATFVSAHRSLLGGTEPRAAGAWLATIARNECSARAQARMREPLPLADVELGHAGGPEAELQRREAVAQLRAAIAELPEKQREAIVLRDLYGLRYTEVGVALGMSVSSVESLLFRARRTLRVSLKPLAGGAVAVPLAVREGVAQAIPGFADAGTAAGGAAGGVIGVGLLAKLAGGPAGAKVAAGLVATLAAGSIAVAKVEHGGRTAPADTPATSGAPAGARPAAAVASPPAAPVVGTGASAPAPAGLEVTRRSGDGADGTTGGTRTGSTTATAGVPKGAVGRAVPDARRGRDDGASDTAGSRDDGGGAAAAPGTGSFGSGAPVTVPGVTPGSSGGREADETLELASDPEAGGDDGAGTAEPDGGAPASDSGGESSAASDGVEQGTDGGASGSGGTGEHEDDGGDSGDGGATTTATTTLAA